MSKYIPIAAGHATLSEALLGPVNGQILVKKLNGTSDKAGSLVKFFPARYKTTADAAGAAGQKVVPVTATTFDGQTVAANDYAIIFSAGGVFMGVVASIVAGVSITLTANIPSGKDVAAGDQVFIVKAADIGSVACGAASVALENQSASIPNMPLGIRLDSTSAGYFSGLAEVVN